MRLFFCMIILVIVQGCSFDKRSGIWINKNEYENNENIDVLKDFKKIYSTGESYNQTKPLNKEFIFKIDSPYSNKSWNDILYNKNNKFINFKYNDLNQNIFKSKKLTSHSPSRYILIHNKNLFINDDRGNVLIYSIDNNKIITKINFYKKKFKNLKKELNFIVEDDTIFISDNIGFIYAYNYVNNEMIWAKNYKIPFRSNIKLTSSKIITSNQNNDLFILDKSTGNLIKQIPTEETLINNLFTNNIALSNNQIYFLNTFGSLYSINILNNKINWFINLNKSLDLNLTNLFNGNKLVYHNNKIIVSSNENFFIIDSKNGSIIDKKNFSSLYQPLLINNYLFLVTKNNLLVAMKLDNGEIIYSYDIADKVAKFINSNKKELRIKNIILVNNEIYVFLRNSFILKFDLKGEINEIYKLSYSLLSYPIFVNNLLFFLDKKKRLIAIN